MSKHQRAANKIKQFNRIGKNIVFYTYIDTETCKKILILRVLNRKKLQLYKE